MKTVTKKELIDRVADKCLTSKKNEISDIVQAFMTAIGDALVNDERVELRDFGVFAVKERKARMARNPKTGDIVHVDATKVCTFKIGKELKVRLANAYLAAKSQPQP